jgi:hypothetical protein
MRRDDFRLLMAFAVFLALLIVWAWPDGGLVGTGSVPHSAPGLNTLAAIVLVFVG